MRRQAKIDLIDTLFNARSMMDRLFMEDSTITLKDFTKLRYALIDCENVLRGEVTLATELHAKVKS